LHPPPPAPTSSPPPAQADVVVVGGGFFGCQLAVMLRRWFDKVVLVEREPALLLRASYNNQARVHNGYHYPRSILTALRSRVNFPLFVRDFTPCVVDSFTKLYAVPTTHSKVSAGQFATFCKRIGAPLQPAPASMRKWFAADLIEDVWVTQEYAFDAVRLADLVREELESAGVTICTGWTAREITPTPKGFRLRPTATDGSATAEVDTRWLFNATYSALNWVLAEAGRPPIPLKHEIAEMALVEVPVPLRHVGVTVMCGPFFSIMPFPARGLHSLSHVRYTPHGSWHERDALPYHRDRPLRVEDFVLHSYAEQMRRDACRYMPMLADVQYRDSLWELKTVLPQSEGDDSRPILFRPDPELPRLVSVMGGKIDNIYDLPREVAALFAAERILRPWPGRVHGNS
jgi:glycine/D-amino acid oxidase-like deaminating enzyme